MLHVYDPLCTTVARIQYAYSQSQMIHDVKMSHINQEITQLSPDCGSGLSANKTIGALIVWLKAISSLCTSHVIHVPCSLAAAESVSLVILTVHVSAFHIHVLYMETHTSKEEAERGERKFVM